MKVAIVGSGYVGLVSGACFANHGHTVFCTDVDQQKIDQLNRGTVPIFEPGLEQLVRANLAAKRLIFTTDLTSAIRGSEIVFIAVGTPTGQADGRADLTYVYNAVRQLACSIDGYTVIVTKSTVPVGTGDEIRRLIQADNPDADFSIVSNPEFLREGSAIQDFLAPDRIVIGAQDSRGRRTMEALYRPLVADSTPIFFTDRRTAELIKYASNSFLAMKVTFINEMADLCEKIGTDIQDVSQGMGLDRRIGSQFLQAGPGYGGSCFPKDTVALLKTARDAGSSLRLVETTVATNEQRKWDMATKVINACGGTVAGKRVCILGLTFKPNTDDLRESPAISIIAALRDAGAIVSAFDPAGSKQAQAMLAGTEFARDEYHAALNSDALVIATEWSVFRSLDLAHLKKIMRHPLIVDLRNLLSETEVSRCGFDYVGIGRGDPHREIDAGAFGTVAQLPPRRTSESMVRQMSAR